MNNKIMGQNSYRLITVDGKAIEIDALSENDARDYYAHAHRKPLPIEAYGSPDYYRMLVSLVDSARSQIKDVQLIKRNVPPKGCLDFSVRSVSRFPPTFY